MLIAMLPAQTHPAAAAVHLGRVLAAATLLFMAGVLVLLLLMLQGKPTVPPGSVPAREYVTITRSLINQSLHAETGPDRRRVMILSANDLTAVANYLLSRTDLAANARCAINGGELIVEASIALPWVGRALFLNIRLTAEDEEPQAFISSLKIGNLNLPEFLVKRAGVKLLTWTPMESYGRFSGQMLRQVRIREGALAMSLNFSRDALAQVQSLVLDLADKERLQVYHEKLVTILAQSQARKRFVRLSLLMQPLFAVARLRSEGGNDPVAENRALIMVLGAYVNNKSLAEALRSPLDPVRLAVLLNQRVDTAQHFMVSAALAITGHSTLTDMVGLAKEMNDTHGGSGFSFNDLAADLAGSAFAQVAVNSPQGALRVQTMLSERADENLFMPAVKDLPENLSPDQFADRFKSIQSPEFQALKDQIDARIRALPLYRAL